MHRIVLYLGINLITACSSLATDSPNYIVIEESHLSDELKETSGLYCPKVGFAYTLNDSGNKPAIYEIDASGNILEEKLVATKNIDWEALTGDEQYFYVGDIGNNGGKREFVQVHAIPKQDSSTDSHVITSELLYTNNSIQNNEYLKHDFDAEALISLDDLLFLFSKSWKTGTLFISQINKIEPKQQLVNISKIEGLPGVITGGDFDKKNNRFILVGYEVKGMGRFSPFIAVVKRDFTLDKFFELSGYGQVEGVCVTPNGELWFTQEGSFFSKQKIVKLNILE